MKKKKNALEAKSKGDRILHAVSTAILLMVILIVGYPVVYVISSSFSSPEAISAGRVTLLPVGFNLDGYEFVLHYQAVWNGFKNSIIYTLVGTTTTIVMDILMAYPLSKQNYQGKSFVQKLLLIAMLTSAGMIPAYILRMQLRLINNPLVIILNGAVGIHSVLVLRTSFKNSIPGELFDAAKIDGASEFQCLVSIAIPLSKATLSVLVLWSAVGCWNDYFGPMIYLPAREDLWPMTLFLRNILTSSQQLSASALNGGNSADVTGSSFEQIQYCMIVITTVPVLTLYMIIQKYFKNGVMIGSVKG